MSQRRVDGQCDLTHRPSGLRVNGGGPVGYTNASEWFLRSRRVRLAAVTTGPPTGDGAVLVRWSLGDGSWLALATNLSAKPLGAHRTGGRDIFSIESVENDRPGSVRGASSGALSSAVRLGSPVTT